MTTTASKKIDHWTAQQNQPEVTVNEGSDVFDAAIAGAFTYNMGATGDADYTLPNTGAKPQAWQYKIIQIIDTTPVLTAPRNIILPELSAGIYFFYNATAQILTLKHSTGTGIAVAAAKRAICQSGGTNVIRWTADI